MSTYPYLGAEYLSAIKVSIIPNLPLQLGDKMAQIEAEKKEEEDKKKAIEDMKKNAGRHFLRKDDVISS